MDIFQKLLQIEEETGKDVSNLRKLIESNQLKTLSQLPPIKDPFKEFEDRNPMAGGGMLVQPSADGSRPGYAQPKGKTKKKTLSKEKLKVLDQYSQEIFGKNYDKLTKPDDVSKVYTTAYNRTRGTDTFKYIPTAETNRAPLPKEQKNKLIKFAKANNIKLDFNKYPRFGVPRSIKGKPGNSPTYQKITDSYKNYDFEIFKKDTLPLKERNFVMDNFELPKGVKKWDFDNFKFGVNSTKYRQLQKRIETKLNGPIKYTIAVDRNSPKGWMTAAMERVYKNQTTLLEDGSRVLKKGVDKLTYEPVFKEGTNNIIIGFKDNTPSGQGLTYYGLNKNTPEGAASWSQHKDYNKVAKFIDITERVKAEPNKILQKILDDKGITELVGDQKVLTLNDILSHQRYFDKISEIKPTKLLERQIVKHHIGGVGAGDVARANATKDIQLLTGAVNKKITGFESKLIKDGSLSKADNDILKNLGAKIRGADGKIYGGGYINPEKQFAAIEKKAVEYAKGDQFNVKTVASYLERLGCGKAAGGRVFYNKGAFGLTKCAEKGRLKLENIVTKGASNADDAMLAKTILKAGGGLKSAFALRNIFGPAAIAATVAFEGGLIGYDMLTSGKTLREAFGDNLLNYALGKDYQIDPQEEMFKRFKGLGYDDQQIGGIKKALDAMNTINTGTQLAMDVGQQQEALQKSREQPEFFMSPDDQMMADAAGQRAEQNLKDARERLTAFNRNLKSVDGPPGGSRTKEDVLSEYFSSGKYAEDLDLLDEAQKAAIVEQKQSALPTAFGKVFPKFEESRIQTISENLPFGGVNPAFNIPVNDETYGEGLGAATFIPGKTTGGLFGLAEGGRAGYRLGKIVKPKPSKVRADAKSIIDENIKLMKQMKETGEIDKISSDLNQVIKKALDEDFFDKKDRIVDSINISEAKRRRNYPYNMQVFEEPKNLDFYTAIQESNFKTKTGPYFDRIRRLNKAGGGLLKQAGDRSGPPPESGPNPQGLQGLLNRVKKV